MGLHFSHALDPRFAHNTIMTRRLTPLIIALLTGCAASEAPEPFPLLIADDRPAAVAAAADPGDWLATPWPSDLWRNPDGTVNMAAYPNPQNADVVRRAATVLETEVSGFALQPTAYVRLAGWIDTAQLAADPLDALRDGAPVQLIALDGAADRFPLELSQSAASAYQADYVLRVRPLLGKPLEPGRRYALVVTNALNYADGAPLGRSLLISRAMAGEGELAEHLAPVRARLADYAIEPSRVVAASLFTTGDPQAELTALVASQELVGTPELSAPLERTSGVAGVRVYQSRYPGVLWQHGEKPYAAEGGGFLSSGGLGQPADLQEPMRVALAVPFGSPPENGWPVVIYSHGTGGDFLSMASGPRSPAAVLTDEGLALVAIDQPLHGLRGTPTTDVSTHTFNPFNPVSSRSMMRQAVLDNLLLLRMIQEQAFNRDGVRLDGERISFFGHSQGGLTAALMIPQTEAIDCWVISGAGGGLTGTLLERKEPLDVAELIRTLGNASVALDAAHPLISLLQHTFEPADPITAATGWLVDHPSGKPQNILFTSGFRDVQTPMSTAANLAMAAQLPLLAEVAEVPWRHALENWPVADAEATRDNVRVGEHRATAGYAQYPQEDHFLMFSNGGAKRRYRIFLTGCAAGDPAIISP
jgi:predicted esterase